MDKTNEELKFAVFDYLRGDLDRQAEAEIEERMIASPEFADYVERVEAFVESARGAADENVDSLDRDAIFASIEDRLADDEPPAVVTHFDRAPEPDEEVEIEPLATWWRPLAAAALLALVGGAIYLGLSEQPSKTPISAGKSFETVSIEPEEARDEPRELLADLEARDTGLESIKVFAATSSQFELTGEGDKRTMDLERGSVLVEYLPGEVEDLVVRTPKFEVRVVGTVFFVDREESKVGVLNGRVEVDAAEGQPVVLSDGQAWQAGRGVTSLEPRVRERAVEFVDIDAHIDALARAKTRREEARKVVERKPVKAPPTPAETLSRRTEARAAIERGEHGEAAKILEAVLAELPARDPAAGSIRLDLARLYINSLNRPQRATVHLRRFIKTRPNDAATPSARRELCRLADELGREEPACDD